MADPVFFKAAEVYVNTPVDRSYTYSIPAGMNITPGVRVTINFAGRNSTGFVTSLHNDLPENIELKDIIEVIDKEPIFDNRLVDLVKYTAQSYLSSAGEAFSKALPGGISALTRKPVKRDLVFTGDKI